MKIECDGDLRRKLGLTDADIGGILGRSRQAVNIGMSQKPEMYFRPQDWILIFLALRSKGAVDEAAALLSYLREKYSEQQDVLERILGPLGGSVGTSQMPRSSTVHYVVSDYRHFRERNQKSADFMISQALDPDVEFRLDTATKIEVDMVSREIREKRGSRDVERTLQNIRCIPEADQYPYMVCLDAGRQSERFFVCLSDRFVEMDVVRGRSLYHYLPVAEETIAARRDAPTANSVA